MESTLCLINKAKDSTLKSRAADDRCGQRPPKEDATKDTISKKNSETAIKSFATRIT